MPRTAVAHTSKFRGLKGRGILTARLVPSKANIGTRRNPIFCYATASSGERPGHTRDTLPRHPTEAVIHLADSVAC